MAEIELYIEGILLAYMAFMLGMFSPGPNILNVVAISISKGRAAGISLALGIAFGSFCWASLTALGLSALLIQYSELLFYIKIFGAAYLAWLAFKAFKAASAPQATELSKNNIETESHVKTFMQGYIVQMTNPKAAMTWIAIISLGLQENAPIWVSVAIIIGATILSTVGHIAYALAFSAEAVVRNYLKAKSKIDLVLGVFYLGAAYKLITSTQEN